MLVLSSSRRPDSLISLKYQIWNNLACQSLEWKHLVYEILTLGLQYCPVYKFKFLFDAHSLSFPYESVKITNLIITWLANYISLIMLWLYDGILGIMCPWLVTFPLTFYRTLWKMLSILAATGCSELLCRGPLKIVESYLTIGVSQTLFTPVLWETLIDHLWKRKGSKRYILAFQMLWDVLSKETCLRSVNLKVTQTYLTVESFFSMW